ncbi:4,5-DOPA dioxygenase extradiol [Desulfofustis limnaeus]|nr:4,5-DOPA dioxygenase extradiol [Desulfofustis limnaeus]MDX9894222.1 4,5-DOPA dioxygenase extradiol [Desulfofustis sp.]
MTTATRMPALFLGHGNPMNAIDPNRFHRGWQELGQRLPKPRALVCISAHWQTRGTAVTAAFHPETIHDFYGFPDELYRVRYPAPGDPQLAGEIARLLAAQATVRLDPTRGFDHGAWSVLSVMYPTPDIPLLQISLDTELSPAAHYRLGAALAPLRDRGILLVGSGNMVHHLGLFNFNNPTPYGWAQAFDQKLQRLIRERDHQSLIDYRGLGDDAHLAIPTDEHYLPLLYTLAVQGQDEPAHFINAEVVSSVAMTSVLIGFP